MFIAPQQNDRARPAAVTFAELVSFRALVQRWRWARWMFFTTTGAAVWVGGLALALAACVGFVRDTPQPMVHDESSYLLAGEIYSRLAFSAPPPPEPEFFESFHVLVAPRHASKFPMGQGLMLALGFLVGHPALGLWLSTALLAAALVWALHGYLPLRWAVTGAIFGLFLFGPHSYWSQSYWGGNVAAIGGALVWGALRRFCLRPTPALGAVFAGGAVILMHSRPLEGLLFFAIPAWWVSAAWVRAWHRNRETAVRLAVPAAVVGLAGIAVLLAANHAVTGSLWRMPYSAYEQRYSSTPNLIWERSRPAPEHVPERFIEFEEDCARPNATFTRPALVDWCRRLWASTRFMIGPVLAIAIIAAFAPGLQRWPRRALWCAATCGLSVALSYWHQLHYLAPATAAAVYLGIAAVRALSRINPYRRTFLIGVALLHGVAACVWPVPGAVAPPIVAAFRHRAVAERSLEAEGGQHLVFVSYDRAVSPHVEFVYNPLELTETRVVWARDLGAENARLLPHFPGRKLWRMRVSPTEVALQPLTAVAAPATP